MTLSRPACRHTTAKKQHFKTLRMAGMTIKYFAIIATCALVTCYYVNASTAFAEAGEPRAICPTSVKVVEGDDVTLQCRLDPPVDVSAYTVDWKKDKGVVHSYRHQQDQHNLQMDQYRNRTHLNHEDLSRGVPTLRISSVRPSDSGLYRCFVSKLRASCVIDVIVVTGDSSTTRPLDEPDDPDGEKRKHILAAVIAAAVVVVLGIIAGALVKSGRISNPMVRFRRRRV